MKFNFNERKKKAQDYTPLFHWNEKLYLAERISVSGELCCKTK